MNLKQKALAAGFTEDQANVLVDSVTAAHYEAVHNATAEAERAKQQAASFVQAVSEQVDSANVRLTTMMGQAFKDGMKRGLTHGVLGGLALALMVVQLVQLARVLA